MGHVLLAPGVFMTHYPPLKAAPKLGAIRLLIVEGGVALRISLHMIEHFGERVVKPYASTKFFSTLQYIFVHFIFVTRF